MRAAKGKIINLNFMALTMAFFHVFIRGENFLIEQNGAQSWMGFYKNVYVEAGGEDEATSIAITRTCADPVFRASVKNPAGKPPELNIEEINEIAHEPSLVDSAFTYFPAESQ